MVVNGQSLYWLSMVVFFSFPKVQFDLLLNESFFCCCLWFCVFVLSIFSDDDWPIINGQRVCVFYFFLDTQKETVEIDCQTNSDGFTAAAATHSHKQMANYYHFQCLTFISFFLPLLDIFHLFQKIFFSLSFRFQDENLVIRKTIEFLDFFFVVLFTFFLLSLLFIVENKNEIKSHLKKFFKKFIVTKSVMDLNFSFFFGGGDNHLFIYLFIVDFASQFII